MAVPEPPLLVTRTIVPFGTEVDAAQEADRCAFVALGHKAV